MGKQYGLDAKFSPFLYGLTLCLSGETNFGNVGLAEKVEDIDDVLVIHFARSTDNDTRIWIVAPHFGEREFKFVQRHGLLVEHDAPGFIHGHVIDPGLDALRGWFAGRKVQFEVIDQLGRGDDKNHQEHKSQVKERRDIQLVERTVMGLGKLFHFSASLLRSEAGFPSGHQSAPGI